MLKRTFTTALACLFAAPLALAAQQEDPPETLRLSFFQCNFNEFGPEVQEELEGRIIPIWDEVVDEGMVASAGYFFHAWASEWNAGVYTVAADISAVIAAQEEVNSRLAERFPDAESPFSEACPAHRDGFYQFGPRTGMDDDEEDEDDDSDG